MTGHNRYYKTSATGFYIIYGKKIFLEAGGHVKIDENKEVEYYPPNVQVPSLDKTQVLKKDAEL